MRPPILLLFATLSMLGCRWQEPPEHQPPPPASPASAHPWREYVFPAGGTAGYGSELQDYQGGPGRRQPSPRKQALLKRHVDLGRACYPDVLAHSKVRLFRCVAGSDRSLLATRLEAAPPAEPGAPDVVQAGPIRFQLESGPCLFAPHEAYVLPAHRRLGAETFREGFGQEDLALLETNLLPWVADLRAHAAPGLAFAPDQSLNELDREPAVFGVTRFLEVIRPGSSAGQPLDQEWHLRLLDQPTNLYLTAMAAPDLRRPGTAGTYTLSSVQAMTLGATRAYHATLLAQHQDQHPLIIHAGPWGVGAYGHSLHTTWAIQRVALEAAYARFAQETHQRPPVAFHYETGGPQALHAAQEADRILARSLEDPRTLAEHIQFIFQRTQTDPAWQANAKPGPGPFLDDRDLDGLRPARGNRAMADDLRDFLTDPAFRYHPPTHGDLGLARDYGSLRFDPAGTSDQAKADRAFLEALSRHYGWAWPEIQATAATEGCPFTLTETTILTGDRLENLLRRWAHDPDRAGLLRNILRHGLASSGRG